MGVNHFEIDIDEIVVSGVPVSDVDAFGAALRARLAGLAASDAAGGALGSWPGGERPALPVLRLPAMPSAGDDEIGASVADALWRGLTSGAGLGFEADASPATGTEARASRSPASGAEAGAGRRAGDSGTDAGRSEGTGAPR